MSEENLKRSYKRSSFSGKFFLSKVYLKNFKSVKEAEIQIRPLTVMVGQNSAGKSTLIQAILLWLRRQNSDEGGTISLNRSHSRLSSLLNIKKEDAPQFENVHVGYEIEINENSDFTNEDLLIQKIFKNAPKARKSKTDGDKQLFPLLSGVESLNRALTKDYETKFKDPKVSFYHEIELHTSDSSAAVEESDRPDLARVAGLKANYSVKATSKKSLEETKLTSFSLDASGLENCVDVFFDLETELAECALLDWRGDGFSQYGFHSSGLLRTQLDRYFMFGSPFARSQYGLMCTQDPYTEKIGALTQSILHSSGVVEESKVDITALQTSDGNPGELWITVDSVEHVVEELLTYWQLVLDQNPTTRNITGHGRRFDDPAVRRKFDTRKKLELNRGGVAEDTDIAGKMSESAASWVDVYFRYANAMGPVNGDNDRFFTDFFGPHINHAEFFKTFSSLPHFDAKAQEKYQELVVAYAEEDDEKIWKYHDEMYGESGISETGAFKNEPRKDFRESFGGSTLRLLELYGILNDYEARGNLKRQIIDDYKKNYTQIFKRTMLQEHYHKNILKTPIDDAKSYFEKHVFHIGPLRRGPSDFYSRDNHEFLQDNVGYMGENTISQIIRFADKNVISPRLTPDVPVVETLKEALEYWMGPEGMGLFESFEAITYEGAADTFRVKPNDTDKFRSLTELGVGVSQVLPVVVQALLSDPGDLLILEEPELHLHPAAQQILADFLQACSQSGRQIIVETHSEYLVSRISFNVVKDPTDQIANSVAIYLTEKDSEGTKYSLAEIDEYGAIDWPRDFFDEGSKEAIRILNASLEKQEKEEK